MQQKKKKKKTTRSSAVNVVDGDDTGKMGLTMEKLSLDEREVSQKNKSIQYFQHTRTACNGRTW